MSLASSEMAQLAVSHQHRAPPPPTSQPRLITPHHTGLEDREGEAGGPLRSHCMALAWLSLLRPQMDSWDWPGKPRIC